MPPHSAEKNKIVDVYILAIKSKGMTVRNKDYFNMFISWSLFRPLYYSAFFRGSIVTFMEFWSELKSTGVLIFRIPCVNLTHSIPTERLILRLQNFVKQETHRPVQGKHIWFTVYREFKSCGCRISKVIYSGSVSIKWYELSFIHEKRDWMQLNNYSKLSFSLNIFEDSINSFLVWIAYLPPFTKLDVNVHLDFEQSLLWKGIFHSYPRGFRK